MDHPTFGDEPYCERAAWAWLIEHAAWKPRDYRIGSKVVRLERGQLVASLRYLATAWGWKKDRVRRFLAVRQQTHAIRAVSATGRATAERVTGAKGRAVRRRRAGG